MISFSIGGEEVEGGDEVGEVAEGGNLIAEHEGTHADAD